MEYIFSVFNFADTDIFLLLYDELMIPWIMFKDFREIPHNLQKLLRSSTGFAFSGQLPENALHSHFYSLLKRLYSFHLGMLTAWQWSPLVCWQWQCVHECAWVCGSSPSRYSMPWADWMTSVQTAELLMLLRVLLALLMTLMWRDRSQCWVTQNPFAHHDLCWFKIAYSPYVFLKTYVKVIVSVKHREPLTRLLTSV